jgi:translation initiation factor 2B subunit (eIF-2B alpha/beta/delta family)
MNSFAEDRGSGSTDVARAFLDELERWASIDRSTSAPELRRSLLVHLRDAQSAQPTMALVHQLAARALEVADTGVRRGDDTVALRQHLATSCATERDDLALGRSTAAEWALKLLPGTQPWIATLSASGSVREALLRAHAARLAPRAVVAEGRPRQEGRDLAAVLAAAGVPTWLVVDAALPLLLSQTSMVWIGADAVTERGVINKVGSFAAALAARESSVPMYAIASRRKFLPAATAALRIDEMPPAEVWSEAPPEVKPRNIYFELVPLELFRGIVVEDGVLGPTEAATLARERPLPDELAGAPRG